MKQFIFSFFFILPITFFAQDRPDYSIFLIDSSLVKQANAVIQSYHSSFHVHSPGEATEKVKMVVTRLNENASYDDLAVHYDMYSKVESIKVVLYDASGNVVRKFKKNEIADVSAVSGGTMYSDSRVKYLNLEYGEYPYTIEYEYEVTHEGLRSYPRWYAQEFRTSVKQSTYELILPKDIEVQSKLHNLEDVKFTTNDVEGNTQLTWQINNLEAVRYEADMPEVYKQIAFGLFIPNKFKVADYQGDMSSWEEYGKFMYRLNKDKDILSPMMSAKVKTLTKDLTTEEEKIAVLYRYLQDNMRYVSVQLGIGGWQTFDAQYVEENKFGDCKALSNFMQAMLKEADIPAYSTLVYAGDDIPYEVSEDFSAPIFNHVILHVPSTDTWLECTSNISPPNYLGTFTADRNVMLITKEGGKLVKTPSLDQSINWCDNKVTINVDPSGKAMIQYNSTLSGVHHEWYRSAKHSLSEAELKKQLLRASDLPMSSMKNFNIKISKEQPEANIQYELEVPRYASKGGKRLFIPVNKVNAFTYLPSAKKERKFAYKVPYSYVERDTFYIQLPSNAKVESMPKAVELSSEFGSLQLEYKMDNQTFICIRKLEVNAMEIPADQFETYRSFLKKIIKKDKAKLVVVINQA